MAIPGNRLKTAAYITLVMKPRKALRLMLNAFYRMDHVYDVLAEVKRSYQGQFSILEFGTNEGYGFRKLLYAVEYHGMADWVTVHGFDTFEGMPAPQDHKDLNIVTGTDEWLPGQFSGGYHKLKAYCELHYPNHRLHRGRFEATLTAGFLETLRHSPPILVWIDCDFYSSARCVIERLIPYLPSGCVVYFDEHYFNVGSRQTGEARVVHEVNAGVFGDAIELVLDRTLSWDSQAVYRFVRLGDGPRYTWRGEPPRDQGRSPSDDSPWP